MENNWDGLVEIVWPQKLPEEIKLFSEGNRRWVSLNSPIWETNQRLFWEANAAKIKYIKLKEAAQEVIDGLPYKNVLDFPELRETLLEEDK